MGQRRERGEGERGRGMRERGDRERGRERRGGMNIAPKYLPADGGGGEGASETMKA